MPISPKVIQLYQESDGSCPYADWYSGLKDKKTQAIIDYRLSRIEAGNLGDFKSLGDGIYELRIHYGPGWRIYFTQIGNTVILLLCGSNKASQQKHIRKAKAFRKAYQSQTEDLSQ